MKKYLIYEYSKNESKRIKTHISLNGFKVDILSILDATNNNNKCGNYDIPWSEERLKIEVIPNSRLEQVLDSYMKTTSS